MTTISATFRNVMSAARSAVQSRKAVAFVLAAAVIAPPILVLASLAAGDYQSLLHIWSTVGVRYLAGTLLLCALVAIGVTILGGGAGILIAVTEFPCRKIMSFALILPFAVPAYITAYAYGDLFSPFGYLRSAVGLDVSGDTIRSLPGAAFVLTLATYAYVYLSVRVSLESRSGSFYEASRSLGAGGVAFFMKILGPLSRAAFAAGLALALMETISDFGVADYFGVATLSVGVFRTWYGLGDLNAASQIASALFLFAIALVLIEQQSRKGLVVEEARGHRQAKRVKLPPASGAAALVFCVTPVLLGFVAPVCILLSKWMSSAFAAPIGIGAALANTAISAVVASAIAISAAILLVYAVRLSPSNMMQITVRLATLGYALPGALIAVGVLAVSSVIQALTGSPVWALAMLIYAYVARFLTAAYNNIAAGFAQINPSMDDAARTLGAGMRPIIWRVHAPIARGSVVAALLIVAIDVARELPATLILRPFNFETLATQVYRLASDERLAEASGPALLLIAMSLVPVALLNNFGRRANSLPNA